MLIINKTSSIPIYEQVIAEFERYILAGLMGEDEKLPSVRALSIELSVNPNTIQKAYTELERRHVCYSVPGNGRYVAHNAADKIRDRKRDLITEVERIAMELKASGITKNELMDAIQRIYAQDGT